MYREVWRLQRDFLYDPNFHGLDLAAAEKKYAAFLDGLAPPGRPQLPVQRDARRARRSGHTYVCGGDTPEVERASSGGLLGADYRVENGRYRFARVYQRRELEPAAARPAHAAGRQRQGGRVPARPSTAAI